MRTIKYLMFFSLLALAFSCKETKTEAVVPDRIRAVDSSNITDPEKVAPNNYAPIDVSPMDMSYFPVDYPKLRMSSKTAPPAVMRVIYSRPHLGRRRLFPDILKHEEPWRLGANEATEIEFYRPVTILNKKIAAGRYVIYCIPHRGQWTIALNSNNDTWGLKPDSTLDVARVEIPITTGNTPLEYFTLVFEKTNTGADLLIGWDDVLARMPITFS